MTETLQISYLNCGFCTAKNHCQTCGAELGHSLEAKPGIAAALVNIPDHTLRITHEMDKDELEDLLDGMGLLAE